jgi:hypothetical protein
MATTTTITLGRGHLSWPAGERRSDRYGTVTLFEVGRYREPYPPSVLKIDGLPVERHAKLKARVVEQHRSDHIGDFFRGIRPPAEPPPCDSVWTLGEGRVFLDPHADMPGVGLVPDDRRDNDWLDPHVLYTLHSQVVDLWLEVDGDA